MSSAAVSEEKNLRAEIQDLSDYLAGLPGELKTSGAFTPYEARLHELQERLAVRELQNLDFPRAYVSELIEQQHVPPTQGSNWLIELREVARRQEDIRRREITFHSRLVRFLSAGTIIGAASAGLAALAVPIAGSLLAGGTATLAAVLYFSSASRNLQKEQMEIAKLRVLRSELEDVFARHQERGLNEGDVRELSRRVVFLFSEQIAGESSPRGAGNA